MKPTTRESVKNRVRVSQNKHLTKNVVKFDGTNFQLWKFQIGTVFDALDIRDVVSGNAQKPANMEDAAGKLWVKKKWQGDVYYVVGSRIFTT